MNRVTFSGDWLLQLPDGAVLRFRLSAVLRNDSALSRSDSCMTPVGFMARAPRREIQALQLIASGVAQSRPAREPVDGARGSTNSIVGAAAVAGCKAHLQQISMPALYDESGFS
jgi:hypothetical protein